MYIFSTGCPRGKTGNASLWDEEVEDEDEPFLDPMIRSVSAGSDKE